MGEFYGNQHTTPDEYDVEYTYEGLIDAIAQLGNELERAPTTRDARDDDHFPCLDRIYELVDDWTTALRDAGIEPRRMQQRSSAIDRRERMLADLKETNAGTGGGRLTTREYDEYGTFATSSIKNRFGSWQAACEAAEISCGVKHGCPQEGPQGAMLDSWHEYIAARFLDDYGIRYQVHPAVGDRWTGDFYLPDVDLWVEIDGYIAGDRPNKRAFARKVEYYDSTDKDYVIVNTSTELESELRRRNVSL